MTIKKVFFDANVFSDIFGTSRPMHAISSKVYLDALSKGMQIYTSCDIATNIYYIAAKYTSKENALDAIEYLKTSVSIIPFGEAELTETIALMRKNTDYNDLEDTIQYIMAKQAGCDVIVSNDKRFVSKEIALMNSKAFAERFL